MESCRCWMRVLCKLFPIPHLFIISLWICPPINLVFLNLLITLVFMSCDGNGSRGIQAVLVAGCATAAGAVLGALGVWTLSQEVSRCQPFPYQRACGGAQPGQHQLEPSLCYCAVNKLLYGMRSMRLYQRKTGVKQVGNLV